MLCIKNKVMNAINYLRLVLFLGLVLFNQHMKADGNHLKYKQKMDCTKSVSPMSTGFEATVISGCAPLLVQFNPNVPGPNYNWNFGDPGSGSANTSTACNPVHIFNQPGTYTVTLTTAAGIFTKVLKVGLPPSIVISGDTISCIGSVTSLAAAGSAANYVWNAVGGIISSGQGTQNVQITWNNYGRNRVTLIATSTDGCAKTFDYTILVLPPPQVNLPCCSEVEGLPKQGEIRNFKGCDQCLNSINCYTATILPGYGEVSDYNWIWTVTGGTYTPGSHPNEVCVQWNTIGIGSITLVVEHKIYKCATKVSCNVNVKPGIVPVLTVNENCVGLPTQFDASQTNPLLEVEEFSWNFGNGVTKVTTLPYIDYTYAVAGSYNVTLTIITKTGCNYELKKIVVIKAGTSPKIDCIGTACGGSKQCYSTELIAGATYNWQTEGSVNSVPDINKVCITWGDGPLGKISLTVTGGNYTCSNKATAMIPIISGNIPITTTSTVCAGRNGSVQAFVTKYPGACYKWTAISGGTISGTSTEHFVNLSYLANSSADIELRVEVDFGLGCCKGIGKRIFKRLPEYTISGNYNLCENSSAQYSINNVIGTLPNVGWQITGGTPNQLTGSPVTINWGEAGTGTITVINNSPQLYCNTSATVAVNIIPKAKGADIDGPKLTCVNTATVYYHEVQNSSVVSSVSVNPPAVVNSQLNQSSISFPNPGNYTITVHYAYTDPNLAQCNSTKTYNVKVGDNSIYPINGPTVVCSGKTYLYDISSLAPSPDLYEWSANGGTIVSLLPIGSATILWNNTVNSSITVTNKTCGNKTTLNVTVNGSPINFIKTATTNCTNTTLTASPGWNSYLWEPGNQSTQTISVNSSGNYAVTVSNGFCTTRTTVNVTTGVLPVITGVTKIVSNSSSCFRGVQICPIYLNGSAPLSNFNWTFTGATPATQTGICASIQFNSIPFGVANFTVTGTDANGCSASYSGIVRDTFNQDTGGNCSFVGSFNTTYDVCSGQFTSTSSNTVSYDWNFGDGSSGSGLNPIHVYSSACAKRVQVCVKDINGCTKLFTFQIQVPFTNNPSSIAVSGSTICNGANQISVNAASICPGSGYSVNYAWTFTTGGSVFNFNTNSPTFSLSSLNNGCYNATCIVTISNGINSCAKSASGSFCKGGLQASFVLCGGCANSVINFTDLSTVASAPIIKWTWNFGNGVTSSLQNPTYIYSSPGNYAISLSILDNNNCISTYNSVINISNAFNPGLLSITKNGVSQTGNTFLICASENYQLSAPAGYSYVWSNGATTQNINITESGDYSVQVFNVQTGCKSTLGPIKFTLKPQPNSQIIGNPVGCNRVTLFAAPGFQTNYKWTYPPNGNVSLSNSIQISQSGLVTLLVSNAFGCSATNNVNVIIKPSPTISISPSNSIFICQNSPTLVTANINPSNSSILWFEGTTSSNSLLIQQTGNYWVEATNPINGCKVRENFSINLGNTPDLSNLPKGCYKTCGPVSFCGGTVPFNFTGQWYWNNTPLGTAISAGQNISVVFNRAGVYYFELTPLAGCFNCCKVKSEIITIELVPVSNLTIISNPSEPVLCRGSNQQIQLSVSPVNPALIYTWTLNGVVVGTGATLSVTQPGNYIVTGASSCNCSATASIVVREIDCCIESPGEIFIPIPNGTVITTNTVWSGKYFIEGQVLIHNGATLDLTNVDCAFGEKGELIFDGNAMARATNSVFRPCQRDKTWSGFVFHNGSKGWISNCVYKNANAAIHLISNKGGVRISNNTFINCHDGIFGQQMDEGRSISGNTFEVDDEVPVAFVDNEYTGIKLVSCRFFENISQNNFRHVKPDIANNRMYGISAIFSSLNAIENKFNDVFRAIDASNNTGLMAFEKNDVKASTVKKELGKYLIRITDCELPVLFYQNTVYSSQEVFHNIAGVYSENCKNIHFKENVINELHTGIYVTNCGNVQITGNKIKNCVEIGIGQYNCNESRVACNEIQMWLKKETNNSVGIEVFNGNSTNLIYSNCIYDCNIAMNLRNSDLFIRDIPLIKNNFLFNYKAYGIYSEYYNGTIGSGFGFSNAGRNTFISNNYSNNSIDIFSNGPTLFESGNYGILAVSNVFGMGSNDEYNSTAACGNQITGNVRNNQLDDLNNCDQFADGFDLTVFKKLNDEWKFEGKPVSINSEFINQNLNSVELIPLLSYNITESGKEKAEEVLKASLNSNLASEDKLCLQFLYSNKFKLWLELESYIQSQTNTAQSFMDYSKICQGASLLLQGKLIQPEAEALLTSLIAIDKARGKYAPMARDMVQFAQKNHPYIFPQFKDQTFKKDSRPLIRVSNYLNVQPVPSNKSIVLSFHKQLKEFHTLEIRDMMGRKMENYTVNYASGKIEISIENLAPGTYIVTLFPDEDCKQKLVSRFIKN